MRKSIGTMDLTLLDEFGTEKLYKKGGKGQVPPRPKTTPAAQKIVMEVRKLEAMLQVAKDKAEAERLAWEEKKGAKRREILELRQSTAALRKEKETYEAWS